VKKEARDGGLKERESPRLEDGANSRGYHSSLSMGAHPPEWQVILLQTLNPSSAPCYHRLSFFGVARAT